jgi:crossover junction endodeoxyribonuclease RuvC
MLILGLDPGTATTGYGLIEVKNLDYSFVDFGLIETKKIFSPGMRLAQIYHELHNHYIPRFKPDIMVIEKVFFSNNAKTVISVGQAQGVMLLAAAQRNVPVVEYAPGTIKKIVTGDGRAKKRQVQAAVRELLGRKVEEDKTRHITKTHIDNAVDALAIALCHMYKTTQLTQINLAQITLR